jgi:hypothetical protein
MLATDWVWVAVFTMQHSTFCDIVATASDRG